MAAAAAMPPMVTLRNRSDRSRVPTGAIVRCGTLVPTGLGAAGMARTSALCVGSTTLSPSGTHDASTSALASRGAHRHVLGMFVITEADAAAIRAVFNQEGELSAAIELRRRFPGLTDNAKARACARTIAGWTPLPTRLSTVTRLRPRKDI